MTLAKNKNWLIEPIENENNIFNPLLIIKKYKNWLHKQIENILKTFSIDYLIAALSWILPSKKVILLFK